MPYHPQHREYSYFNPRSYKRSDSISTSLLKRAINFNPRSYKRSDSYRILTPVCTFKFQSTLLQEERLNQCCRCLATDISIHAPTRGATPETFVLSPCNYFNPRSYKRSDNRSGFSVSLWKNFNPRSYKRSDLYIYWNVAVI